jgi:hypothetical protein
VSGTESHREAPYLVQERLFLTQNSRRKAGGQAGSDSNYNYAHYRKDALNAEKGRLRCAEDDNVRLKAAGSAPTGGLRGLARCLFCGYCGSVEAVLQRLLFVTDFLREAFAEFFEEFCGGDGLFGPIVRIHADELFNGIA